MTDLVDTMQDLESEEALVGAILANTPFSSDPAVLSLSPRAFTSGKLRDIWKAFKSLSKNGDVPDSIAIGELLNRSQKLEEIGGHGYLTQLQSYANLTQAPNHLAIVRDNATRRDVIRLAERVVSQVGKGKLDTVLQKTYEEFGDLRLSHMGVDGYQPGTWEQLSSVLPKIEWLWNDWIPRGFLTEIVGAVEIGKSAFALKLAGVTLSGGSWPDGQLTESRGKVVWLDTESTQGINMERAKNFGLPMNEIIFPQIGGDIFSDILLTEPEGWMALEIACREPDVQLIVIDSLGGGMIEENKPVVKVAMKKLSRLAAELNIAMVVIHHPRKLGFGEYDVITLDRVRGHSSIVQFARSILALERPDPNLEAVRVKQIKNNLTKKPDDLGFEWADNLLAFRDAPQEPKVETMKDQAINLLQLLLKDGPVAATEIYTEAEEAGMSKNTMRAAKKALGIAARQSAGRWHWALPAPETAWSERKDLE